jgi:hypothetical protein
MNNRTFDQRILNHEIISTIPPDNVLNSKIVDLLFEYSRLESSFYLNNRAFDQRNLNYEIISTIPPDYILISKIVDLLFEYSRLESRDKSGDRISRPVRDGRRIQGLPWGSYP